MQFTFNHPMDETSFFLGDDVASFEGPDGPLTVNGHCWIDPYTLEVTFDQQSTLAGSPAHWTRQQHSSKRSAW